MQVQVAYATPTEQVELSVEVSSHATVAWAIRQSGVLEQFPELKLESLQVGIFSRRVTLDTVLQAGDRVEIYRPLSLDPKEARRRRLQQR